MCVRCLDPNPRMWAVTVAVVVVAVFHLALGVVSVCVGVAASVQAEIWLAHSVSPIWSGCFWIITGLLGFACAKKKTAYLIMCFTAFCIVSLVVAVVSIQLLRLGLVNHTTDGHTFQKEHKDVLILIALGCAGVECIMCVGSSIVSCRMAKVAKKELQQKHEGTFHVQPDDGEERDDPWGCPATGDYYGIRANHAHAQSSRVLKEGMEGGFTNPCMFDRTDDHSPVSRMDFALRWASENEGVLSADGQTGWDGNQDESTETNMISRWGAGGGGEDGEAEEEEEEEENSDDSSVGSSLPSPPHTSRAAPTHSSPSISTNRSRIFTISSPDYTSQPRYTEKSRRGGSPGAMTLNNCMEPGPGPAGGGRRGSDHTLPDIDRPRLKRILNIIEDETRRPCKDASSNV